jgi:hypothetical protein
LIGLSPISSVAHPIKYLSESQPAAFKIILIFPACAISAFAWTPAFPTFVARDPPKGDAAGVPCFILHGGNLARHSE